MGAKEAPDPIEFLKGRVLKGWERLSRPLDPAEMTPEKMFQAAVDWTPWGAISKTVGLKQLARLAAKHRTRGALRPFFRELRRIGQEEWDRVKEVGELPGAERTIGRYLPKESFTAASLGIESPAVLFQLERPERLKGAGFHEFGHARFFGPPGTEKAQAALIENFALELKRDLVHTGRMKSGTFYWQYDPAEFLSRSLEIDALMGRKSFGEVYPQRLRETWEFAQLLRRQHPKQYDRAWSKTMEELGIKPRETFALPRPKKGGVGPEKIPVRGAPQGLKLIGLKPRPK